MSEANARPFYPADAEINASEDKPTELRTLREASGWDPERFAREQIRGLVRQVFLSNTARPVRQVVFTSPEPETEVRSICRRVAEALAAETMGSVAIVGGGSRILLTAESLKPTPEGEAAYGNPPLRQIATHPFDRVWQVPAARSYRRQVSTASLHLYLGQVRREFDYALVEGGSAGEFNEAISMAQFADGVILVVSARHTRRATAHQVKEMLQAAQIRLLGTVLSDRAFPIPEAIYRRL
jgi:hypothetical protein